MDNKLTIYLADDHQLIAEGIATILKELNSIDTIKWFPNGKLLYKEL